MLKDREKLGILGPAELSSANEGAWWLRRLCTCLGRVYTDTSVPLVRFHCKLKLLENIKSP